MHFSAADLVKRSASQIAYLTFNKIKPEATPGQYKGEAYQEAVIHDIKEMSSERRGTYMHNDHHIHFCIDGVKDNLFIEIKKVDNEDEYPQWYLESSIMQSVFYTTLLHDVKKLVTPTFKVKEGYLQYDTVLDHTRPIYFELWFGNKTYRVTKSHKIRKMYLDKVDVIAKTINSNDWSYVRQYDSVYKHKEFLLMKPRYRRVNRVNEVKSF